MTKFWGKLFLINFAIGVVTGIVQEFQFGMNWSEYSRYVGDIFGAPLAMEALLAFFWNPHFLACGFSAKQLRKRSTWLQSGSSPSARTSPRCGSCLRTAGCSTRWIEMINGRPAMNDAWAVFTNNTALIAFPHAISGALVVAGALLIGISWYHLWRRRHDGIDTIGADGKVVPGEAVIPGRDNTDHGVWIRSLRTGAAIALMAVAGPSPATCRANSWSTRNPENGRRRGGLRRRHRLLC